MSEQFGTLVAMNALCDAILVPRGAVDDTQAPLCKVLLADLGKTCKVLALQEVPPLFLGSTWAEIEILACAEGIESVLDAELLEVAGAFLVAVHARSAVFGVLVVVERANVADGETRLCIDAIKDLVESSFACKCVGTP